MNDLIPGGPGPQTSAAILARLIGATTLAAGAMMFGAGTSALSTLSIAAANTVLTSSGSAPQWSSSLTLGGTSAAQVLRVNGSTATYPWELQASGGADEFYIRSITASSARLTIGATGTVTLVGGITAAGQDYNLGAGGTGSANATMSLNGSSASSYGARIRLLRNSVYKGELSTYGAIFGGASDDITLRAASGIATRFYADSTEAVVINSAGVVSLPQATASTSTATGALVVSGGVGVGGHVSALSINVSGGVYASGNVYVDATAGMVFAGVTGSAYDWTVLNGGGVGILYNPAGTRNIVFQGAARSNSDTAGIGYATGAGGTVAQITSRTTGVTLNKVCGEITLFNAAGSTTATSFTVTCSAMAATDQPHITVKSATNKYLTFVTAKAAGSFEVTFYTTGGTASDAPVFAFDIVKAVAA